jgi:hypothetical protein
MQNICHAKDCCQKFFAKNFSHQQHLVKEYREKQKLYDAQSQCYTQKK